MNLVNGEKLSLGVCYYPEHWNESLWEDDFKRMKKCGIQTMRIGEFAWSKIEYREGEFDYSFFDRFLDAVQKNGMHVIFGTPTATPPAWLTKRYEEVLNTAKDGTVYRHGARRHYNYNSGIYQELSKRIVEKTVSHYGQRPCIIGWQIDNEINCEIDEFYSESDTLAFRQYLKEKYNTLNELNEAWGTVFWNQTYTDWDEIYVPRTTPCNGVNPHMMLDYIRFVSDSACRFVKMQSDIICKYKKKRDFVTTNGIFSNLDYHRMTKESLDFITYDSYPNMAYCQDGYEPEDALKDRRWSQNLTEVRAVSTNFGIMEQQSGANGWNSKMMAPAPKPGQMTLWSMQSIAHGADYISFFRWRTAAVGTEIYWHGILDYSGRDNRRMHEVEQISRKMECMKAAAGSQYEAFAGIIRDYDNIWDAQNDLWHQQIDHASRNGLFAAFQYSHTPFDHCYLEHMSLEQLKKYRVLFYPHACIMTKARAELLEEYAAQGGCLVFGCRGGYKDIHGHCVTEKLPGLLRRLTGTDIPEYSLKSPEENSVDIQWENIRFSAQVFHELLTPIDSAGSIASYTEGDYAGSSAVIRNRYGKGEIYYFGSVFTEEAAGIFLRKLNLAEPYGHIIELPRCCEIAVRRKENRRYLFVLNYSGADCEIKLARDLRDMETGNLVLGLQVLKGYEVKVYEMDD